MLQFHLEAIQITLIDLFSNKKKYIRMYRISHKFQNTAITCERVKKIKFNTFGEFDYALFRHVDTKWKERKWMWSVDSWASGVAIVAHGPVSEKIYKTLNNFFLLPTPTFGLATPLARYITLTSIQTYFGTIYITISKLM